MLQSPKVTDTSKVGTELPGSPLPQIQDSEVVALGGWTAKECVASINLLQYYTVFI